MDMVVGRGAELDVVDAFVAAARVAPSELAIEGEPGIGKTTVFRHVVETARAADVRVLSCRLTESESTLSFAALTDLLHEVDLDDLGDVPAPQRRALDIATLRGAPAGADVDGRAVGTGLATVLGHLAGTGPLLVAVDDAQWVDRPSAEVIAFAVRRVHRGPLGIVTCRRPGSPTSGLRSSLAQPSWGRSIELGGLSPAALFDIVRSRLDVTLSRPSLVRIADASRGNPFVAIELARAASGRPALSGDDLSLTPPLQDLLTARLAELSPNAQEALLAVACAVRPTLRDMEALGLGAGVDEAERAGVLVAGTGVIGFDHPLLSSAVLGMTSAPAIRRMHARLAELVTDPEAHARHVALARPEPDERVSAALDRAATSAAARGAAIAATDLARLSLEHSPTGDPTAVWARRLRLAGLLHRTGSSTDIPTVLANADPECPHGSVRAAVELLLSEVTHQTSSVNEAIRHAHMALEHAGTDPILRARALLTLAALTVDGVAGLAYAEEAGSCLADAVEPDNVLSAWAKSQVVSARFQLGEGLDRPTLEEALALERTGREWSSNDQVATLHPVMLKWADLNDEALAALDELRNRAIAEGNDAILPYILGHLAGVLLRAGRSGEARAVAAEHLTLALSMGQASQRIQALYNTALIDAHSGLLDDARAAASEVTAWAEPRGDSWIAMSASGVLGFVALCTGDHAEARSRLDHWASTRDAVGLIDPGVSRFYGDHIESVIATGDLDLADQLCDQLELAATRASRSSAVAVAARSRALVAASSGRPDRAAREIERALLLDAACPIPIETGRSLMAKGVIHRRAREKAQAREALSGALTIFERIGATSFAARASAELDRVGTRAATTHALTASERRVAELAASGLTNRQVAEQAFISPKTVEANLARVYRKLGISSRAELGARMARAE